ncbi:MAG: ATP-binding protein [Hespellia sp.]|nr:ATP-binding protein [Hespellia sp.]
MIEHGIYQVVIYIIDILKIYIILRYILELETLFSKRRVLCGMGIIACCLTIQIVLFSERGPLFLYIAITCITSVVIFNDNIFKISSIVFFIDLIMGFLDGGIGTLLTGFFHLNEIVSKSIVGLVSGIVSLLVLLCVVIIIKRNNVLVFRALSLKYFLADFIAVILYTLILLRVLLVTEQKGLEHDIYIISLLIGCCFVARIGIGAYLEGKSKSYKEKNEIQEQYMMMQKKQYEYLVSKDEDTRKLHHDYKQHMEMLSALCEIGNLTEVKNYLHTMRVDNILFQTGIETHNVMVNAILEKYQSEEHIELDVIGHMPAECSVASYDLVVIFSNIMRNAVEAVSLIDTKKIEVELRYNENQIFICEKNACNSNLKKKNGKYISSKQDEIYHGIGLQNIKACVEKYNGFVELGIQENYFKIMIMLYY